MTERLVEGLQIERDHSVESIVADGDSYLIDGNRFAAAVLAVPGTVVLGIKGIPDLLSEEDGRFFQECEYQPVVSLRVATKQPVDGRCYAVSIPRVEKFRAATISFHDYIAPASVTAGRGLLTVSGGGAGVSSDQLMADLMKLYPIQPESTETAEWKYGMPMFPPGRYRQIVAFQGRERRPGLVFCGDYLMGPFIEGAITSGFRAADEVMPGGFL